MKGIGHEKLCVVEDRRSEGKSWFQLIDICYEVFGDSLSTDNPCRFPLWFFRANPQAGMKPVSARQPGVTIAHPFRCGAPAGGLHDTWQGLAAGFSAGR